MQFQKISWNEKRALIRFTQPGRLGTDSHEIESPDAPHPDFVDALQAMRPHLWALAELIPHSGLSVSGVTLKQDEDKGTESITITGVRSLEERSGVLVINSPHVVVDPDEDVAEALENLKAEARRYVEGKRAQAGLFDGLMPGGIDSMTVSVRGEDGQMEEVFSARKTAGRA